MQHMKSHHLSLETAIGSVARAAKDHGDSPRAIELWRVCMILKAMREPEVVALLDRRQMRRVRSDAGMAA